MRLHRCQCYWDGGDPGDHGDTIYFQSRYSSPLLGRRRGALGIHSPVSVGRPHVPTFHFVIGDREEPNQNRAVPTIPALPAGQEAIPGVL